MWCSSPDCALMHQVERSRDLQVEKRYMNALHQRTPPSSALRRPSQCTGRHQAPVVFSHKMCLPAAAAFTVHAKCRLLGSATDGVDGVVVEEAS